MGVHTAAMGVHIAAMWTPIAAMSLHTNLMWTPIAAMRTHIAASRVNTVLVPPRDDVEGDFQAVADADGAVEGGGGGDFEVAPLDGELAAGAQVLTFERDLGGYHDAARDAAEREVAAEFDPEGAAARIHGNVGALEGDVGVLVGLKHDVAQLAVDDLLLLRVEDFARLGERGGADVERERGGADRARRQARLAREVPRLDEVVVPLEPEQPAREGADHELAAR